MNLTFAPQTKKEIVFTDIKNYISDLGFRIIKVDENRPWGGFLVIDEDQSSQFIKTFFSSLTENELFSKNRLSPKILVVEPGKRLSWQYHYFRSELWKVIGGDAGVAKSDTDEQTNVETYKINSIIKLKQGERHRLVGLDTWGIVAEIWQHINAEHPSNEDDIVRVQDDFGR